MIGNKYKATSILGLVSIGFFLAYPFQDTFIGGILSGGFGAAMIGGLADWFAVSALFRRPLGIPFRTAIIPRNREKIFKTLTDMVENEILVAENIKKCLDDYDISKIVITFMTEHDGKSYIKKMIYRFLQDMLAQLKPEEIITVINNIVQYNSKKIKVCTYIVDILEWLVKKKYHDRIIDVLIQQCIIIAKHKKLRPLLAEIFVEVKQNYEHGMSRRKIFNDLMDLSLVQVAMSAQQALVMILFEMKDKNHPIRQQGNIWLAQFIIKLKTNVNFQQEVDDFIQQKIIDKINIGSYVSQEIILLYGDKNINKQIIRWLVPVTEQIDKLVIDFSKNQQQRIKFDSAIKHSLIEWIDTNHNQIGMMVQDTLKDFTNEKLINFIENKVGNDLQMIRINGSVVGGFVGIIIYLLTFSFK